MNERIDYLKLARSAVPDEPTITLNLTPQEAEAFEVCAVARLQQLVTVKASDEAKQRWVEIMSVLLGKDQ